MSCPTCLRAPRHAVQVGGAVSVNFCDSCWRKCQETLMRLDEDYWALVAQGVHPAMAERVVTVGLERDGQTIRR